MLKNSRIQTLLIVILALAVGGSTYIFLSSSTSTNSNSGESSSAFVATSEIPAGTTFETMLRNSWIEQRSLPATFVSPNMITSASELSTSQVLRTSISSGQLVLRDMFAPAKNFASGLNIPKGFLAVSISADDVARVANFVVPGSRVVIFASGSDSQKGDAVTKILVSDALVLAIGTTVNTPQGGLQVASSPLVTLAVNPFQAAQIINASQNSRLSFALAYGNDPQSVNLSQVRISSASLFS